MESIACGTPVVGFNIGGIPDMIRHGENGFLATLGDSIDLAQKVNQILNNDELSSHMSTNARRIAEQDYV
jgi:glycosyltransferase involved in cell wall biosynthesis